MQNRWGLKVQRTILSGLFTLVSTFLLPSRDFYVFMEYYENLIGQSTSEALTSPRDSIPGPEFMNKALHDPRNPLGVGNSDTYL